MRGLPAVALVAAVLWSCASVGRIEGGPYDETPPRFVRSTPEPGALNYNNEKRKRISIEFDEYIVLEGANEKVVISPPQIQQPEIKTVGKRVQVTLEDSLKPNTTYTIDSRRCPSTAWGAPTAGGNSPYGAWRRANTASTA